MKIMLKTAEICFVTVLLVLLAECRTTIISVTSDPSGAKVFSRGCGRMGYTWENKGTTPVSFESMFSSQNTMVLWPDGTKSEIQYHQLSGLEKVDINFKKNKPAIKQ